MSEEQYEQLKFKELTPLVQQALDDKFQNIKTYRQQAESLIPNLSNETVAVVRSNLEIADQLKVMNSNIKSLTIAIYASMSKDTKVEQTGIIGWLKQKFFKARRK